MMPEILIKIAMQIYSVTSDEAEQMLCVEASDDYDDD